MIDPDKQLIGPINFEPAPGSLFLDFNVEGGVFRVSNVGGGEDITLWMSETDKPGFAFSNSTQTLLTADQGRLLMIALARAIAHVEGES